MLKPRIKIRGSEIIGINYRTWGDQVRMTYVLTKWAISITKNKRMLIYCDPWNRWQLSIAANDHAWLD